MKRHPKPSAVLTYSSPSFDDGNLESDSVEDEFRGFASARRFGASEDSQEDEDEYKDRDELGQKPFGRWQPDDWEGNSGALPGDDESERESQEHTDHSAELVSVFFAPLCPVLTVSPQQRLRSGKLPPYKCEGHQV